MKIVLALAAAVTVLLFAGTLGPWTPSSPTPSPASGSALDTAGVVVRRIWAGPKADPFGSPSPDGRYLTFVDWETGDLALHDLHTGEDRRLTDKGTWFESNALALFSIFAPDGHRIAYAWAGHAGAGEQWELRTIGVDGSDPRVLYRNESVPYLQPMDWSSDGGTILTLFLRSDGVNQLALVSAEDGSAQVLKTLDWRAPTEAALSPDGRWVVYDVPGDPDVEERDVFVIATDGTRENVLVRGPANDFPLGWMPDGRTVLFASDRDGTLGAWLAPISDGRPAGPVRLARPGLWQIFPVGMTATGSYFYGMDPVARQLHVGRMDRDRRRLLGPATTITGPRLNRQTTSAYAWSPDGRYLAYLAQRQLLPISVPPQVIAVRAVETGQTRELSLRDLRYVRSVKWMGDGTALLVTGSDTRGGSRILRLDVRTGETREVLRSPGLSATIRWADWVADGAAIVYNVIDEGRTHLLRRGLGSGTEEVLYAPPAPATLTPKGVISPDRRWVVFEEYSVGEYDAIRVVSTDGGRARTVVRWTDGNGLAGPMTWGPDGRSLYYTASPDRSGEAARAWKVALDGGQPQELDIDVQALGSLRFHPDGERVAYAGGRTETELWVLEGLTSTAVAEGR